MIMSLLIQAEIRRFVKQAYGSASKILRLTGYESLSVAQNEPARYELSRAGFRYFGGNQIIANGIAPVTAIPTTTATVALYNSSFNNSIVLERLGFWLGSGTPAAGATLLATVSSQPIATAPSLATGWGSQSASGSASTSNAVWGTAVTLPSAGAWFQVQSTQQLAAVNVGQGFSPEDFEGAIIVKPRCALGLAILSGAGTTPLYGISATWTELESELE